MKKKCASSFPTLRSLPVRPLAVDSTKQETQRYAVLSLGFFFVCFIVRFPEHGARFLVKLNHFEVWYPECHEMRLTRPCSTTNTHRHRTCHTGVDPCQWMTRQWIGWSRSPVSHPLLRQRDYCVSDSSSRFHRSYPCCLALNSSHFFAGSAQFYAAFFFGFCFAQWIISIS